MARITNSNAVRLGSSSPWVSTQVGRPNSLLEQLVIQYASFFLQNSFNHNETSVNYVLGSVKIVFDSNQTVLLCSVFSVGSLEDQEKTGGRAGPLAPLQLELEKAVSRVYASPVRVLLLLHPTNFADANFVLSYFKLRVLQRVPVTEIVNTLHKLLADVPGLMGYRFDITGRFSRQQRAGKLSVKKGITRLSTLSSPVQYAEDFIILKHGKCGFKIWMNRTNLFSKKTFFYIV